MDQGGFPGMAPGNPLWFKPPLRAPLRGAPAPIDLCPWFTGDTRPAMWVLDRVTLVPR